MVPRLGQSPGRVTSGVPQPPSQRQPVLNRMFYCCSLEIIFFSFLETFIYLPERECEHELGVAGEGEVVQGKKQTPC